MPNLERPRARSPSPSTLAPGDFQSTGFNTIAALTTPKGTSPAQILTLNSGLFSPGPPASTILYRALSTPKTKSLIFFLKACSFHDLSNLLIATSSLPLLRPKPGAILVDTFAQCLSQQQILFSLPGNMSRIQSLSLPRSGPGLFSLACIWQWPPPWSPCLHFPHYSLFSAMQPA